MSSRVNVKFVVILSAVLVAVFAGVAATLYFVLHTSAAEHYAKGERLMETAQAAADPEAKNEAWSQAERALSKAVNKEPTNLEYLREWRVALENIVPENRETFDKRFGDYITCLREIARIAATDVEAHHDYLSLRHDLLRSSGANADWATLVQAATTAVQAMSNTPENPAEGRGWPTLMRYAGIGRVAMLSATTEFDPEMARLAQIELERALAADPTDVDAADSLATLHAMRATRARAGVTEQDRAAAAEQAITVLEQFAERNPQDPRGIVRLIEARFDSQLNSIRGLDAPPMSPDEARAELQRARDLMLEVDPELISETELGRFRRLEVILSRSVLAPMTGEIVTHLLEERPDDAALLVRKADLAAAAGRLEAAIAAMQEIRDLPRPTLSLDGYQLANLREVAASEQSGWAFTLWEQASAAGEGVDAAKQRVVDFHEVLKAQLPADSPRLKISEARLAFVNADYVQAQRLLEPMVSDARLVDPQALWILFRVAYINENWTRARTRLEQLLQVSPADIRAALFYAEVLAREGRLPEALAFYEQLDARLPDNDLIRDQIDNLRVRLGLASSGDAVADAILRASRLARGEALQPGDPAAAAQVLRDALATHGPDARLYILLLEYEIEQGELERARQTYARARAELPDNEQLAKLSAIETASDPTQVYLSLIDQLDVEPVEKTLRKIRILRANGQEEQARSLISVAAGQDPDNPQVIELLFNRALSQGDRAAAEAAAEAGAKIDLDGVNGGLLRATVESRFGDQARAITMLRELAEDHPGNALVFQRLGIAQINAGRVEDGIEAFEEALSLRGSDASLLRLYATELARVGRQTEALEALRDREQLLASNPALLELRLDLEATVGDEALALARREALYAAQPNDRNNAGKLAALYVDRARWSDARRILDRLRAEQDTLGLVQLDALWHARQGNLEGARAVYSRYIAQQAAAGTLTADPYLALGALLREFGDEIAALETFRSARRFENPETLIVEKTIGGMHVTMGQFGPASESFKQVVDAGLDDAQGTFRKRLAEAYTAIGQLDLAAETLEPLSDREEEDFQILLLKAGVEQARDDIRKAREHLDRAVRLFSDEPDVFFRRAALAFGQGVDTGSAQQFRDALADLTTAVELAPGSERIRQLRGQVYLRLGDTTRALADYRAAVVANPSNQQLFINVMGEMIRIDRAADASALADEVIEIQQNDLQTTLSAGRVFAAFGQWDRARRFFRRAWDRVQTPETARLFTASLLRSVPPSSAAALEALGKLEPAQVERDPDLLFSRAEALLLVGDRATAINDAVKAFGVVAEQEPSLPTWFARARRVFTSENDLLAVIDALQGQTDKANWIELFRASTLAEIPASSDRARAAFERLITIDAEPLLRSAAYQAYSNMLLTAQDYDRAAEVLQDAIAQNEGDWRLLNNLAFTLAERLDRAAEALPYAERAAELAPRNPEVADTLGWTQYRAGNLEDAATTLERALALARGLDSEAVIAMHLAEVRADQQDGEAARRLIRRVQDASRAGRPLPDRYQDQLSKLQARVDSLP